MGGQEWLISTPKHVDMYNAFGWRPPQFAHVGLLTDTEGQKLSKRNFDTEIASYRKDGVIPSALINFLALMGCSFSGRSDVMSLEQLVSEVCQFNLGMAECRV